MINSKHLQELEELGFGNDIAALESYVSALQDAAADGEVLVDDPVYDRHYRLLRELKPDSELLKRNWEKDSEEPLQDYDEILKEYGMRSITTCVDFADVDKFAQDIGTLNHPVDILASFKMNGHGVREVYVYGDLVSATTRGRYKKGRDITRHMGIITQKHVEYFESFPLVEIRGELLVSYKNFKEVTSTYCKTPLSSVTSLIRDSVSDDELKYLDFIAYKIIIHGLEEDDTFLTSLLDEFEYLDACGFKVPYHKLYTGITQDIMGDIAESILTHFASDSVQMGFDADGVVIAVDDNEDFYSLGLNGNTYKANAALKMGKWECNKYVGVIREITWEHGKSWFTPKAVIEPVTTVTGAEVRVVPLYNVGVVRKLGLKPGSVINFRFGGETGVQLLTPEGESITNI